MAKTSVIRDRKDSEIRRLAASGKSQRLIATQLGISRGIVQRVLDSDPARPVVPVGLNNPDDFSEVEAEYESLAEAALANNTLDGYRAVHKTALMCHEQGYGVRFHALPYLMLVSDEINNSDGGSRERLEFRAEFSKVCSDLKAWRAQGNI